MSSASKISLKNFANSNLGLVASVLEFMKDLVDATLFLKYSYLSAYYGIKANYKASYLGPIWIVLSNVVFISFISLLYSSIFNIDLNEYIPYFATGYLLWTFMVTVFLYGSSSFILNASSLKDYKINPLVIFFGDFFRALIVFAHNLPIILLAIFYFKGFVCNIPMFMLGLCINLLSIFFMTLSLSLFSCRFRDIYYLLPTIFQILILLMPILWKADMLVGRKVVLLEVNVLYQLFELVRAPLLGNMAPTHYYINSVILLLASFLFAAVYYVRNKNKIVFWS